MDPLHPETAEGRTVPLRHGSAAATDPAAAPPVAELPADPLPPETPPLNPKTLSLRRGNVAPAPTPVDPALPAPAPEQRTVSLRAGAKAAPAPTPGGETVSLRKVQEARPPVAKAPPRPTPRANGLADGAAVSIQQVKDMRAQMAAEWMAAADLDAPPEPPPDAPAALAPLAEAPASTPAPSQPAVLDPAALCPRCNAKLISPESLGMCPSCGYCRSLEEGKDKVPTAGPQGQRLSLFGLVEFLLLFSWVPGWCWLLLSGLGMIGLLTVYALRTTANQVAARDTWGLVLLVSGFAAGLIAHLWALLTVAADDEKVGPWDMAVLSFRVWGLILRRLPETGWQLALGCWGLGLILSSIYIAGLPFAGSGDGVGTRELRQALVNLKRNHYRSLLQQAASDLRNNPAPSARADSDADDRRPTSQCVVIGYQVDDEGKPSSLILATARDGALRYSGVVRDGLKRQSQEVLQSLSRQERAEAPPGAEKAKAIWVKPGASVEVHHSGTDGKGTLQEPNLGRVLRAD